MKRILIAAVALLTLFSVQMSAQKLGRFGVTAGMNFNTSKFTDIDVKARTGWHAGVTYLVDLPLGFSLQPSLMYNQKSANITNSITQDMGYIELPVSVQWGPDLLLFRPFIDVTPYIGVAMANKTQLKADIAGLVSASLSDSSWEGKQRFEYGVGIGGGINVWKLQLIARYNWNFGSLYNVHGWDDIKEHLPDLKRGSENYGGVTLSLSYIF